MTTVPRLLESPLAAQALARARILYTDMDGTLLGRGGCLLRDLDGRTSLAGAEAVAAVNEAGLDVMIVSGRTVPMLKEIGRMLGWSDFVAETGAIRAYDRGAEMLHTIGTWAESDIPEGSDPYRVIEASGAIAALFEAFPGKLEYHTPHHTGRVSTHLLRGHVDRAAAQAVLDRFSPPTTLLDNGVIRPPRTTLDGVDTVHAYHVMPKGASKAAAISADLERRGLAPDDAIMIGDSMSDLAVCDAVGLVVLVANALHSPAVAETAPRLENAVVTDGAAGEGWAELARAWLAARG